MPSTTLTLDQWAQIIIGGSYTVDQYVQVNTGGALISLGNPTDATTVIDSSSFDDKVIYVPAGVSVYARPKGAVPAGISWGNYGAGQSAAGYEMFDVAAASRGVARVRSAPVRIPTLGDSQANFNSPVYASGANAPNTTDSQPARSSAWNTAVVTLRQHGRKWGLSSYYPQAYPVANGGVSGETTTQILARDSAAESTTRRAITDVLNLNPDAVLYRGGSINNFAAVNSQGAADTAVATANTEAREIINRIAVLNNIPMLVEGIYGYFGTQYSGDPDLIRQCIVRQNANLKAICAQYPGLLYYVDPVGVLSDASGNWLSPNYYVNTPGDIGIHPNGLGQLLISQAEAAGLKALFGASASLRYRGLNLFLDPLLMQSSPANGGLTTTQANATVANQKIETIDGKRFFTAEFTNTSAGGYGQINIPFNPTAGGTNPLNVSSGDIYGFECDVLMMGLNGSQPIITDQNRISAFGSSSPNVVHLDVSLVDGGNYKFQLPAGGINRHVVWPAFLFGGSAANLTTSSAWFVRVTCDGAGDQYKLGIANPRIVKLDQAVKTA